MSPLNIFFKSSPNGLCLNLVKNETTNDSKLVKNLKSLEIAQEISVNIQDFLKPLQLVNSLWNTYFSIFLKLFGDKIDL